MRKLNWKKIDLCGHTHKCTSHVISQVFFLVIAIVEFAFHEVMKGIINSQDESHETAVLQLLGYFFLSSTFNNDQE